MNKSFETMGLEEVGEEDIEVMEPEKIEEDGLTKAEVEKELKKLEETVEEIKKEIEKRKN